MRCVQVPIASLLVTQEGSYSCKTSETFHFLPFFFLVTYYTATTLHIGLKKLYYIGETNRLLHTIVDGVKLFNFIFWFFKTHLLFFTYQPTLSHLIFLNSQHIPKYSVICTFFHIFLPCMCRAISRKHHKKGQGRPGHPQFQNSCVTQFMFLKPIVLMLKRAWVIISIYLYILLARVSTYLPTCQCVYERIFRGCGV